MMKRKPTNQQRKKKTDGNNSKHNNLTIPINKLNICLRFTRFNSTFSFITDSVFLTICPFIKLFAILHFPQNPHFNRSTLDFPC